MYQQLIEYAANLVITQLSKLQTYKYHLQIRQLQQLKMGDVRKAWTADEDHAICTLVKKHGTHRWSEISKRMFDHFGPPGRTGKQCRQRWHNHLNPKINKSAWTDEQQKVLFQCHQEYGNKWKSIAQHLKGRTDNDIKNKFYSSMRKKLRKINKLLGVKNSTSQVRQIKPKVLSSIIFAASSQNQQIQQAWQQLSKLIFCKDQKKLAKLIKSEQRTKIIELIQKISSENTLYLQSKDNQKIDQTINRQESLTKRSQSNVKKRQSSQLKNGSRINRRISLKRKQTIKSRAESRKEKQVEESIQMQENDDKFVFQLNLGQSQVNRNTFRSFTPYLTKKSSLTSNIFDQQLEQKQCFQSFLHSPLVTRSFTRTPSLQTPGACPSPGIILDFKNNQFGRAELYNQIVTTIQNQVHRNTHSKY